MKRYNLGCLNALAYALLTVAILTRMLTHLSYLPSFWPYDGLVVLDALQICAAVACFIACLSLPRRPAVEYRGTPVDGQYTVSAFGRYTFTWAGVTLVSARNKKTFDLEDLPNLHVKGRSAYLQEYFKTLEKRDQLWKTLVFAHLPEFLFQTVLTALESAAQFLPQLVLYQLLKRLESRAHGDSADGVTWVLVVALGLGIIFAAWTQNWLFWIVWARLGQPIRTELSAMIFGKATRRKDVKGMQRSRQASGVSVVNGTSIPIAFPGSDEQTMAGTQPVPGSSPGQAVEVKADDESEEDVQKSRQSTINLVVRVTPFVTYIQHD